jgi:glycine cleavage system H lipoate-binding protein
VRVGITDFAAEALGDIVYVTLPQVGEEVATEDSVAEVESTKSVSEVYAPLSGVITAVNEQLTDAPDTSTRTPTATAGCSSRTDRAGRARRPARRGRLCGHRGGVV